MFANEDEKIERDTTRNFHLVIPIFGWAITLSVAMFTKWEGLPNLAKYGIGAAVLFLFLLSFGLIAAPLKNRIQMMWAKISLRRKRKNILIELTSILDDASKLLESDYCGSVSHYLHTLCNIHVQNGEIHPKLKGLCDRINILNGWYHTLVNASKLFSTEDVIFCRDVYQVISFHHDLADIIRDLTHMNIPDSDSGRIHLDDERLTKEKYNRHMERLEHYLNQARKIDPDLGHSGFNRF
jgi:hypothetical protein